MLPVRGLTLARYMVTMRRVAQPSKLQKEMIRTFASITFIVTVIIAYLANGPSMSELKGSIPSTGEKEMLDKANAGEFGKHNLHGVDASGHVRGASYQSSSDDSGSETASVDSPHGDSILVTRSDGSGYDTTTRLDHGLLYTQSTPGMPVSPGMPKPPGMSDTEWTRLGGKANTRGTVTGKVRQPAAGTAQKLIDAGFSRAGSPTPATGGN